MYAKCGELDMAQKVFDELPCWDVLTWNALIGGYCQHGQARSALGCYFDMKQKGYCPDSVTFTIILNACGILGQAENGKEVHAEIVQRKLLGSNIILGSALVTMYANVGDLIHAQQVFDELPVRNVISWTTLISGYCDHGYGEKALMCFEQMKHAGFSPDVVTFSCVVTACGVIKALDKGKELHSEIARKGLVCAAVVGNALIDMYAKCNAVAFAWEVFDNLESPDVVSWNTLISGYCQYEHGMKALSCCKRMTCEAMAYNAITTSCILRACGMMGALDFGTQIHARLFVKGPQIDVVLGNALVDMYSKCGQIIKAHEVFDSLASRDVVSWNIMLSGYYENELTEEVFHCLRRMKSEGFCPDDSTFSCVLKACNSIGAIGKGREMHSEIVKSGLSSRENTMLGNDLLNMYAKCGMLGKAQQVLDELCMQDDIPWNSLISGFCEHGYSDQGLQCYERMMQVGVCPTAATFACILRTCAGIGATTKGQMYFETINLRYGLLLNLEHYTCMVDLFARAGYLNEALRVIEKMPSHDYLPAWCALLSACWKCENPKMAKLAFENVVRLDRRAAVAYAFMIDLFVSQKRMGETWISA
ncbi:hypothetical protein KP509_25G017100 [Ceratopteris richardii]|nr:hypothetical protein KP509_25G017100 [Ceratopteris richardii]